MVQKIIAAGLHSADQECTAYTTDLMEKLEQAKAENPSEDAILDDVAANAYCEQFALTTFAKGDRDMTDNKATKYVGHGALEDYHTDMTSNTADALLAASAFLDMLSIWKKDDPEITSKTKYAKYHALRIIRATKAGEDPNLTNPVKETPPELASPAALDPNDPEVQSINQGAPPVYPHNPYQPYVETAPSTNAQPSPSFSARNVSPPPNLPNVPTGYSQNAHNDVSPISQPTSSRRGSVRSIGGGYFPRTDPPTFTAGNVAPSLPTAPSMDNQSSTQGLGQSTLPTGSSLPQAPQPPDPSSFYQNPASPPPTFQPPQQSSPPHSELPTSPPQSTYSSPPGINPYAAPPPQAPQQPTMFNSPHNQPHQAQHYASPPHQPPQAASPYGRPPQQNPYAKPSAPPPASSQGPFRDDERSIAEAQKHAKWAISALNFDDAATAVKELRIALQALGAN